MSCTCGCCTGTEALTPESVVNRPGLSTLRYRVGTHASFLSTMLARLTTADSPALARLGTRDPADAAIAVLDAWATIGDVLSFYQERIAQEGYLRTATERRSLLELARLVGYTPRPGVSASAYLAFILESGQTATIPAGTRAQSVPVRDEQPQPFETSEPLEARAEWNLLVPRQTQPQWITLDRETPAAETDVTLIESVYFKGTATNLRPNDPLLFVFGEQPGQQELRFIESVQPDSKAGRTLVGLQPEVTAGFVGELKELLKGVKSTAVKGTPAEALLGSVRTALKSAGSVTGIRRQALRLREELARVPKHTAAIANLAAALDERLQAPRPDASAAGGRAGDVAALLAALSTPPSLPPANRFRLAQSSSAAFANRSDTVAKLIGSLRPELRERLYPALTRTKIEPGPWPKVYALRLRASLYGHNAPKKAVLKKDGTFGDPQEWSVFTERHQPLERTTVIDIAGSHPEVLPDSWLIIQTPESGLTHAGLIFAKAGVTDPSLSRGDYGMSGEITRIPLRTGTRNADVEWIDLTPAPAPTPTPAPTAIVLPPRDDFTEIRDTAVFAAPEELPLAEEPITDPICGATVELDAVYDGLEPGRWLIVSGERADVEGVAGLTDAELVMVAGVRQDVALTDRPNQRPHGRSRTVLTLALGGLAFCYRRPTVSIYGNVAHATHGETRREVLGSGDAVKPFQEFNLKQSPLTFISAATPDGAASTLRVRVDDLLWHETDGLGWVGPRDRRYVTRTDERDKTYVRFGDGSHGLRPSTGVENIRALYRNGIGRPGNVGAGRIGQLATRPLGVKSVVNPIRSSGGADPDGIEQTRRNLPLATSPLDRLVSVEDYADLARRFAGIGKASAARLSDGHALVVQVTIAGADDIPIDETSDLFRNLSTALHLFGNPFQQVRLVRRESLLLVISAGVKLLPDYEWESVEPRIRSSLLDTFGFDRRALGQSAYLSEAIAAIQRTLGVAYVDVDVFDAIGEANLQDIASLSKTLARSDYVLARPDRPDPAAADPSRRLLPAQLAWLTPDVPETLLLQVLP